MKPKIIVNGAQGKMGRIITAQIETVSDFELVASTDRDDDLADTIDRTRADIVIDFTTPQAIFSNAQTIIAGNARPVIGTTGLTLVQIEELTQQCHTKKLGGIIAPNFSIGAVLMMKYAQDAARYFSDVEIIEMHHQEKLDAPSGTAIKTAQMIGHSTKKKDSVEINNSARGN